MTLASALTSIASAASVIFGGGDPVILGDVTLQGFEIPEQITFGGQQQLTVHKFPGGARVIDAMGPDARALDWSGIFFGPGAATRARRLNTLKDAGEAIDLTWSGGSYVVVIASFEGDYRRDAHVPYRISCTVLEDDTTANVGATPSLLDGITSDIGSALGISGADITGALATAQTVVQQASSLIPGSGVGISILSGLTAGQGALSAALPLADAAMTATAALTPTAASIASLTSQAGALSGNFTALGYVGRAVRNLAA